MLKEMLSSGSKISSKRVLGLICMILIILCVLIELFTLMEVSSNTFDSLIYLEGGCVLAVASEKFGKNKDENK
jgi:hypothetical protein